MRRKGEKEKYEMKKEEKEVCEKKRGERGKIGEQQKRETGKHRNIKIE